MLDRVAECSGIVAVQVYSTLNDAEYENTTMTLEIETEVDGERVVVRGETKAELEAALDLAVQTGDVMQSQADSIDAWEREMIDQLFSSSPWSMQDIDRFYEEIADSIEGGNGGMETPVSNFLDDLEADIDESVTESENTESGDSDDDEEDDASKIEIGED